MPATIEIIRAIHADVGQGDFAAAGARCHRNFTVEQDATRPFGGVWHVVEGFARMGGAILGA